VKGVERGRCTKRSTERGKKGGGRKGEETKYRKR
jgi:hypothetical protein